MRTPEDVARELTCRAVDLKAGTVCASHLESETWPCTDAIQPLANFLTTWAIEVGADVLESVPSAPLGWLS